MKEPIIQTWDDIDRYVSNLKVEATEERRLAVNGREVVLDLTAEHAKTFDEAMAPYLAAGQAVKKQAEATKTKRISWWDNLRAWADANGRSNEYRKERGQWRYGKQLKEDYRQYLKGE